MLRRFDRGTSALMYHQQVRQGPWCPEGSILRNASRDSIPLWFPAVLAVVLLLTSGIAFRTVVARVHGDALTPVDLPVPLAQIPLQVEGWVGEDLEIEETTEIYMKRNFADDFVSRRYLNMAQSLRADLYVVYCSSRPGGIIGHQPRVCFPAHGWIHDGTEVSQIESRSGRSIRCLVHRFHRPAPSYQQIVVVSYYVLNGSITLSERDFSGFLSRRPNLSGDPARYVAQVQVSAVWEHSARTAAADFADTVLAFLPDQYGYVKAAHEGR